MRTIGFLTAILIVPCSSSLIGDCCDGDSLRAHLGVAQAVQGSRLVRTPSLGFSSTGAFMRCPPSATSGIRGGCTNSFEPARAARSPIARSRRFKFHIGKFGPQSKFGYKDFIPMFKAEKFNPDDWAELFQKSGARYIVPVAEHHDGFAMYIDPDALERRSDGTEARCSGRTRKGGPSSEACASASPLIMRSIGATTRARTISIPVTRSISDLYQPHPRRRPRRSFSISGMRGSRRSSTSITPTFFGSTSVSTSRSSTRIAAAGGLLLQPGGGPRRRAQYKNVDLSRRRRRARYRARQARQTREMVWQTDTSVSSQSWGYIDNDEFRTPDCWLTTWSTSSARTVCCCSTSAHDPMGPSPTKQWIAAGHRQMA